MKQVKDILNEILKLGACSLSSKATDWKSLCWLFFTPQGREFCKNNNYPQLDTFRSIKQKIQKYGVYVDENVTITNKDTALVGQCNSHLHFKGTDRAYKVILMHGAFAHIHVGNYAVVRVENLGGVFEIINDGTAKVLY